MVEHGCENGNQKKTGFEWKYRHLVVLALSVLGVVLFQESRGSWSEMHRWNRAFGDMGFVLIGLAMAIGPLARLFSSFRKALPWRRELGIYGVILSVIHTVIILAGWVEWDLVRLFGYEVHPANSEYVMLQNGFGLANTIGIIALAYGIVLACTSNNLSQRWFGGSIWKFLQQSAYIFWMLVIVHTGYFLYLHFQSFHRQVPEPNWAQIPAVGLVVLIASLQMAAFVKMCRSHKEFPPKTSLDCD